MEKPTISSLVIQCTVKSVGGNGQVHYIDADSDCSNDSDYFYEDLEEDAEPMKMPSPEHLSFVDLEKKMTVCETDKFPSGAIKILVMEEGNGPLVPPDAEVVVHYAAFWERAKAPFDSTLDNNGPKRIQLGVGKFLPGLEVALSRVRGPRARLMALLRPAAAWGELGAPPRILPQPALFVVSVYEVHEVDIMQRFNDLPSEEQSKFETTLRMVESIRNRGKDLFARENYRSAIATYQQATNVLTLSRPETEAQQKQLKDLKVKMFLNLAICYYKLEKPKYILKMLDRVDSIVDVNTLPKALFYYGRAYQMLSQTEKAINYFKSALKLEPKNKEIGETLFELDVQLKQSAEKEQLMWQKAFDSSASAPPKKKVKLTVDEDFEGEMREVCKYLAGSEGSDQVELPVGLSDDEVLYVKESATQYSKLTVAEEGIGEKRKVTIIKNP